MHAIDPIFVAPRIVARDWGRYDLGDWCKSGSLPDGPVGEAWLLDPANATDLGPLGRRLARSVHGMLGDLGRAPPKLRLVFPASTMAISSTAPVSLWTVLEPGISPLRDDEAAFHRPGDRIRAFEGAPVSFAAGSVALEVSSAFQPTNAPQDGPAVIRLPPASARQRATLFRDSALSVERWALPEWSRIIPDGQTCHVLSALTPGVTVDGRRLQPGETVFVPAWGRPLDITAANVSTRMLVAYPDKAPTSVWRHSPGPDPAAGQLPRPAPARPFLQAVSSFGEPAEAA